ncbi:hypothetical protein [Streptomyces thinghirensis]
MTWCPLEAHAFSTAARGCGIQVDPVCPAPVGPRLSHVARRPDAVCAGLFTRLGRGPVVLDASGIAFADSAPS